MAHRGSAGDGRPENGVAAVRAAFAAGAHGVTVDIRLSSDDVPVCVSDAHLLRLSGAPVAVSATRWSDLAALPLPGGHRLALLTDVVTAAPDGAVVVADLGAGRGRVCDAVAGPLLVAAQRLRIVVSSRSPGVLREVHRRAPTLSTALAGPPGADFGQLVTEARRYAVAAVHPHVDSALAAATAIHAVACGGLDVIAWSVNRPVDVACLGVTGLTGIVTDDVPTALGALRRTLTGVGG